MARMLGRYRQSGCGCRSPGPDCAGNDGDTRWRKRVEQRVLRQETAILLPPIPDRLVDLSDCRHGCNGDCEEYGSDLCTWLCHPVPAVVGERP